MNRKKLKQKIKKIISSLIVYSLLFFVTVRFYDYFKKLKKPSTAVKLYLGINQNIQTPCIVYLYMSLAI